MNPSKTNEQVLAESTNVAQDAAGMIGGTFKQAEGFTPNVNATNVPATLVTNPGPALTLPPTPTLAPDMGVTGEAKTLLDQKRVEDEARLAETKAPVSDSEKAIKESFGILGTESDTRTKLEDQAGLTQRSEQMRRFEESLRRQSAQLDQFDISQMNDMESMRLEAGRRDMTKGQFSARAAELNLQRSMERAGMVAGMRADIAALDVMQGNYKQAAEQVDKALKSIYEPVKQKLEMEMFFLERNDRRFDSAQKELASTRMMEIQREQQQIQSAQDMVNTVVSNGYARSEEVAELVSLSENPAEQIGLAQMITNRGAGQMREMQMQQMRMSIAASQVTLDAKNKPDPMQSILMSLFDESASGVVSFDDYIEQRTEGVQGPISPNQYSQLEREYQQAVAQSDIQNDKAQRLAFLVGSGAVSPQQADYIRDYINVKSPKETATAAESVRVAQTVARDIQMIFQNIQFAGAENATRIEQIEGRRGSESQAPLLGEWQLKRTRQMASDAQPIYDLKSALDSVASNMSMENLNKMRQNSPTGGALGNVSDKQSSLLSDLLGSTKLEQSPEQLRVVMEDLINFQYDVIYGHPTEIRDAFKLNKISYNQAQQMLGARMSATPEMLGLSRDVEGTNKISSVQLTPDGRLVPIK